MDYISEYASFLKKFLKVSHPIKIIFDCSNGTTGPILEKLFQNHPFASAKLINSIPDGNFPAHGPNPLEPNALNDLQFAIRDLHADLGIIFDADGDRVFFVDDAGRVLSGDHTAILIGMAFQGSVVLDLRMGYSAHEWFLNQKRNVVDSRVGHYFIKKLMRAEKIPYAAELSGHYYFSFEEGSASGGEDIAYWDSGIFAAIQFLNNLTSYLLPLTSLSAWIDEQPKYYQSGEINFEVKDKERVMKKIEEHYKDRAAKILTLDGLKMEFPQFWFNVRPSNTEDLLRLNLEAKEKTVFDREMGAIDKIIKSML